MSNRAGPMGGDRLTLPHFRHHNIAALPRTGATALPLFARLAFETNNQ